MGCLGCGKDKYIVMALLEQRYSSVPSYGFNVHDAVRDFSKGTHLEDYSTRNDFQYAVPSQQTHYQVTQYSPLKSSYYSVGVNSNNVNKGIDDNTMPIKTKESDIGDIVRSTPGLPKSETKSSHPKQHNPIPLHYKVFQARENKELRHDLLSKINSSRTKQAQNKPKNLLEMKI